MLFVTADLINEVGTPVNSDLQDFVSAVKVGPPWITRHGQSICQQALQTLENWRAKGLQYPPYLAYLALFVLADTVNTGFARHSYYPGLRSLLGEVPQSGMYPSFHFMYRLWEDLAIWSNQDKHGEWGVFDANIVGEWTHVGLPRAQTLLTEEERNNLPFLFADNGFDPSSLPSDVELAYLLSDDPARRLRQYTKKLLRPTSDNDQPARNVLIEVLMDELQRWDGSIPRQENLNEHTYDTMGNLRLTLVLDTTARTVRTGLRCRSNREYPAEGLQFTGIEVPGTLYCFQDWQGWSTLLSTDEAQRNSFDASQVDWRNGLKLSDSVHGWRAILQWRPVRVMVTASQYGFDGLVEESQLPKGKSFCLLAHNCLADLLQKWGAESCDGFREVDFLTGLPKSWRLYLVERAKSDAIIRDRLPFLAFPKSLRIQLHGGLKVRGNQYFTFALPNIEVTGTDEDVDVCCNDYLLPRDDATGLWEIPAVLRVRKLVVEVRRDDECICKRSLYSLDTTNWQEIAISMYLDRFGQHHSKNMQEACSGAIVYGFTPPQFNPEVFIPPGGDNRVFYIGRNPGEIATTPSEPVPRDWLPVWAIPMRKRGYAIYCATDLNASTPMDNPCSDKRRVKKWIEVLWHKRKRIEPPRHPTTLALWKAYQEAAHRAG